MVTIGMDQAVFCTVRIYAKFAQSHAHLEHTVDHQAEDNASCVHSNLHPSTAGCLQRPPCLAHFIGQKCAYGL